MRDRLSTKILSNGATRYGVYDEDGNLLRYEYIKLEDDPTVEGDLFSKANMLPDSIPAALGLKMGNPQVKDALNVLANIGNVHVWERAQTYAEEVPAGYTLGELQENVLVFTGNNNSQSVLYYADSISVDKYGMVSLVSPSSYAFYANSNFSPGYYAKGKFFYINPNAGSTAIDGIWFLPSDSNLNRDGAQYFAPTIQKVTGYAAIPAGTTTDYLTSTDRNAYPDQSAEGGEPEIPAHYTLADAATVNVLSSDADYSAVVYVCDLNSIVLNNDGSINTTSFSTLMAGSNSLTMAGNWTKFSPTEAYYITSGSSNVVFTDTIFTVSAETTLQYADRKYVLPGCRELIGHAKVEAIPPNTSITYLGQLGGGARIEVGSYVGTGTYGKTNPNSLTFGFEPKFVLIRGVKSARGAALLIHGVEGSYIYWGYTTGSIYNQIVCTWNGKNLSFYANDSACYCNTQSDKYLYIAIG